MKIKHKILLLPTLIFLFLIQTRSVLAQNIYSPRQKLGDLLQSGITILFVTGVLIMVLNHFNIFGRVVLKKILVPSYITGLLIFVFVLISKLGFLRGDIAAGIPPFYARWGYMEIFVNYKIFILILSILVLSFLSYLVFKKVKSAPVFLALLTILSFLVIVLVNSQSLSWVAGDIGFFQNIQETMVGRFTISESEYVGDIDKVQSNFMADYAKLLPINSAAEHYFSSHSSTHPPGPILLYWIFSKISTNILFLSAINILLGALGIIPLYLVAQELYGRHTARTAAWLYLFVPGIILYAATCFDATLPFFFGFLVYFFLKSLEKFSIIYLPLFGLFAVLNILLSFTIGLAAPFFLIFFILHYKIIRKSFLKLLGLIFFPLLFQGFLFYL